MSVGIVRYVRLYKSIKSATHEELGEMLKELLKCANEVVTEANSRKEGRSKRCIDSGENTS